VDNMVTGIFLSLLGCFYCLVCIYICFNIYILFSNFFKIIILPPHQLLNAMQGISSNLAQMYTPGRIVSIAVVEGDLTSVPFSQSGPHKRLVKRLSSLILVMKKFTQMSDRMK